MQEAQADQKKIPFFRRVTRKWYLFLISLILIVGLAWAYIYFAAPLYRVQVSAEVDTRLLPERMLASEQEKAAPLGTQVIERALRQVDAALSYYAYPAFLPHALDDYLSTPIYPQQPLKIQIDSSQYQLVNVPVFISFNGENEITVKVQEENVRAYNFATGTFSDYIPSVSIEKTVRLGSSFESEFLTFQIAPGQMNDFNTMLHDLRFVINPLPDMAEEYQQKIEQDIYVYNTTASIELAMRTDDARRSVEFLKAAYKNALMPPVSAEVPVDTASLTTYRDQILQLSDSLQQIETELADLEKDISQQQETQREPLAQSTKNYTWNQVATLDRQLDYLKRTRSALQQGIGVTVAEPKVVGIKNESFNEVISQYNRLNEQIFTLEDSLPPRSPELMQLREEFATLSRNANEAVNQIYDSYSATRREMVDVLNNGENPAPVATEAAPPVDQGRLNALRAAYDSLSQNIEAIQQQEKQLSELLTRQDLAGSDISTENVISKVELLWPEKEYILAAAALLALLLPLAFIGSGKTRNVTAVPPYGPQANAHPANTGELTVLTTIPEVEHDGSLAYYKYPESALSRSFDDARTSLDYFHYDEIYRVIGITSPLSGSSKTFCAMNLSAAFSGANRKVMYLSADLSKPQESDYFALQGLGLVDYVLREDVTLEQIIQSTGYEHHDYIEAGVTKASLKQISESPRLDELFEALKARYDLIVVDNPEIRYKDYYLSVSRFFDINLFVLRHARSKKISKVYDLLSERSLKNPYLLIDESRGSESGNSSKDGGSLIDNIFNS
ncbi:MAG: hypothetical protein ACLFQ0_06280 [Cyclobacteriaceae bacterium]